MILFDRELFIRGKIRFWSFIVTILCLLVSTSLTIVLFSRIKPSLSLAIIGVVYNVIIFSLLKYKLVYEIIGGK